MKFQPGAIVEVTEDSEKDKRDMALNCGRSRVGMIGVVLGKTTPISTTYSVKFEDADGTKHIGVYNQRKLEPVMHTTIDTEQDEKIADFIENF